MDWGVGSASLSSMLEKLDWFCLISLITLLVLGIDAKMDGPVLEYK